MNEPLINPWIFYWIDVVDKLSGFLFCISILCIAGVLWYLIQWFDRVIIKELEDREHSLKKGIFCICLLSVSLLFGVFIPSKETMYKMLIASQVTPHNLQVSQEVANDLLDNIEGRAVKLIQEVKK